MSAFADTPTNSAVLCSHIRRVATVDVSDVLCYNTLTALFREKSVSKSIILTVSFCKSADRPGTLS